MRESRGARVPGYLCRAARCRRGARSATSGCRSSDLLRVARVVANRRWYRPSSASPDLTEGAGGEGDPSAEVAAAMRPISRRRGWQAWHRTHVDGPAPSAGVWCRTGMKALAAFVLVALVLCGSALAKFRI